MYLIEMSSQVMPMPRPSSLTSSIRTQDDKQSNLQFPKNSKSAQSEPDDMDISYVVEEDSDINDDESTLDSGDKSDDDQVSDDLCEF